MEYWPKLVDPVDYESVELDGEHLFVSTLSTPKELFELVWMTGDDLLLLQ